MSDPPDPELDNFRRIMVTTFEDVVHGPPDVPLGKRKHVPGYIDSALMAYRIVVKGPAIWDNTGQYLLLRVSRNGWLLKSLCGRLDLTEMDFIGWCSLAKTIFDRSYTAPEETGTSGIYRATRDFRLQTEEGLLYLPDQRIVALLNSHLLCDLGSIYVEATGKGIGTTPWRGAMKAPHPNHHPDFWHRIGFGIPNNYPYNEIPTLDALITEGLLDREYDGDKLMKDIPERWHTWRDEDEESIL